MAQWVDLYINIAVSVKKSELYPHGCDAENAPTYGVGVLRLDKKRNDKKAVYDK